MPAQTLTVPMLCGHWSHGIAHGYYGGSHDFRFIFLPDGRGAFVHDGWFPYRYASFCWRIRDDALVLTGQRYRVFSSMGDEKRCLQVLGPLSLRFDSAHQRECLEIAIAGEPADYYLVTRDVQERDLQPELLASDMADGVC